MIQICPLFQDKSMLVFYMFEIWINKELKHKFRTDTL